MVSRCAAVLMAAAVVADVPQPLPVDLHALDGDASPDGSVSLLQTRMEKMRKSQVSVETADGLKDGAAQASEAMKEMGEAITNLFSLNKEQLDKPKDREAIKERAAQQSTAIGKASHAIEDVKQAFSKLLAQEEIKAKAGKEKAEKKEHTKDDDVSFAQSKADTRIGHSSTFNLQAAADFWEDADVKASANAKEAVSATGSQKSDSASNIDIWDDDWKTASNAGSLDVTHPATEGSYLSQSSTVHAALEGKQAQKTMADDKTQEKVVLSWDPEEEPSKHSLLSAKTGAFPLTMAKEQADEDETVSSKKYETTDEQVVKAFAGGNVAQNSKSVQSILGDMLLSPDDQGMFGVPQEHDSKEQDKAVAQNQSALTSSNQSKSEAQNETVLATQEESKPNKTSLATVGRAIKSVIKSVENSSWPWSKHVQPAESSSEVLAKDVSNTTKELHQDASAANQTVEVKTSADSTVSSSSNTTKEDATKASANKEIEKANTTVTKENATGAVVESSNKTAQEDIASGTKSNKTSEAKTSANETSNSTDKK